MKTLPNKLTVFNATPHTIRFWREGWEEPVEVEPDQIISATIESEADPNFLSPGNLTIQDGVVFVRTRFYGTNEGQAIAQSAYEDGADIVIGSIIAAQAYPGLVVGMTPAKGYERVPPAEKRMNPDKFTVF